MPTGCLVTISPNSGINFNYARLFKFFVLNFIILTSCIILHSIKMADKFQIVHRLQFYEFNTTAFNISVVKNLSWNKYYVAIQRNAVYVDKKGEKKLSDNSVYLTLASVPELLKHLEPALRFAQALEARDKGALTF